MTDLVRLGLTVDSQGFVRAKHDMDGFRKSAADTTKQTDGMGKTMSSTTKIAAAFGRALGLISVSLATTGIVKYADAWTNVENRIKLVTESTEDLVRVTDGVVNVALRSHAALEETASLYSTLARYAGDLVDSDEELLRITETLNKSFAVSGAGAAEQAGAIRQLSQALASGALRGDEFNSINENAPRIMDAVSKSLNLTKGELREFAAQGGITAEIVINAVSGMADEIDADFASMDRTMSQFWQNASTNITQFIGSSESVQDVVQVFGRGIVLLSENLDVMADAALVLAAILGARLTQSIVASTAAFVANTSAMAAAAAAAGVLRGAYALIGGPVGVAAIAAAGLYIFLSRAKEAAQPTLDLTEHVDQLTESFRELGAAQREQAAVEAAAALEQATKRLARAQAALADGMGEQIRAHEFWTETYRLSEDQIRALRIEVELAQDEFNKLSAATAAFSKIDIDLKTKEFLEYNGWLGEADESQRKAAESQKLYNDALAHVNKILPLVLSNYEKIKNSQSERAYRDIATALAEERAALYMTNKEQDIYNFLKSEAAKKMLPEHRQAIIDQISALHDEREALAALAGTSAETAESMGDDVGAFGTAWNRGVERMRDVIGDFFQQIVVDGSLSFKSLADGFKRLIAEMIATAAANKVMVSLGLAGASGSALASGAGSALSGGAGLASVGGVLTSIEGLFAKSGLQAGADFMYGLQTQFANAGSMVGGGMGAGLALTAGAGILGGMAGTALGESLFGKQAESHWGAAIGGIAGAFFGSTAGPLGAAIGAALGGALDAAFGGDGKKRVTLGVETDPMARAGGRGMTGTQVRGASGLLYTGRATRADGSAADELVMMFAQIDDALTSFTEGVTGTAVRLSGALKGSSSQAGLSTQDSGINSFFGAADFNSLNQKQLIDATGKFIDAWLEAAQKALGSEFNVGSLVRQYSGDINAMLAFIDAFGQLMSAQSIEPVRAAMDAQIATNRTLLSNYDMITSAVHSMAGAYDGSLDATQALTAALSMQQQTAYQLASAYLEVQTRVDSLFGGLSENIRMSLMSEQELYDYQRAQIEALSASIDMMSDPETIMRTAEQIEAQITQVWGRLDEEQRKVMGPEFLSFIDQTNQIAQDKLKEGLESVETTQAAVLQTIQEGIQSAASTMQLASNTFMQGANMLVSYAESVSSRDSGQLEVNR